MTCRGADQIMLMYVVRSMNLWASTDMRLTISPTVEDFLAELVITRACGTKERGRVSVAEEEPALCLQALVKEGGWLKSGKATALSSSPADLPVFPPHPSQHEAPLVLMHSLPPQGSGRDLRSCLNLDFASFFVHTHHTQEFYYHTGSDSAGLGST